MNKVELISKLNSYLSTFENCCDYDEFFPQYRDFFKENPVANFDIYKLDDLLFWEYSKYIIHYTFQNDENHPKKDLTLDEISAMIDSFKGSLSMMSSDELNRLLHFIIAINNFFYLYESVLDYFECNLDDSSLIKKLEESDFRRHVPLMIKLKNGFKDNGDDFSCYLKLLFCNKRIDKKINFVNQTYLNFKYNLLLVKNPNYYSAIPFRRATIRAGLSTLKTHAYYVEFNDSLNNVNKYVCDTNNRINNSNFAGIRELKLLRKAIKMLEEENDTEEIKDVRKITKNILNQTLEYDVLSFVKEHNENYKKSLEKKLHTISNNECSKFDLLLFDHGYEIDSSIFIDKYNYDDLKNILDIFDKIFYGKKELISCNIIEVLNSTNLDRVNSIFNLYKKGYLSSYLISTELVNLFNLDNDIYDAFLSNINLLNNYGFNPSKIIGNGYSSILLNKNILLEKNIKILESYDLLKYVNKSDDDIDYGYLFSTNLIEKIDIIIETGCYEFLTKNISCLNSKFMKRLYLEKDLKSSVNDQDTFDSILSNYVYIVDDKKIDDYIYNAVEVNREVNLNISYEELESYKVNNLYYSIAGVIVSYNRVKRLLSLGNSLYSSIFTGLVLSDEEYESIIKCLRPVQYKKINFSSK